MDNWTFEPSWYRPQGRKVRRLRVGVGKARDLLEHASERKQRKPSIGLTIHRSITLAFPNSIALMSTEQTPRRIPDLRFRVLVMGRANAGKTSILQRVCDTTESPKIYRGRKAVSGTNFVCESDLTADQFKLQPTMDVSDTCTSPHLPPDIVPARRAHH